MHTNNMRLCYGKHVLSMNISLWFMMPYPCHMPKAKAARPPKVGASEVSCGCWDWVRDINV